MKHLNTLLTVLMLSGVLHSVHGQRIPHHSLAAGLKTASIFTESNNASAIDLTVDYQRNYSEFFALRTSLDLGMSLPVRTNTVRDYSNGELGTQYFESRNYFYRAVLKLSPVIYVQDKNFKVFLGFGGMAGMIHSSRKTDISVLIQGSAERETVDKQTSDITDLYLGVSPFFGMSFPVGGKDSGSELEVVLNYDNLSSTDQIFDSSLISGVPLDYIGMLISYRHNFKKR